MSQAENDIKKMMEQSLSSVTGLLRVATDKLSEAKENAKTDEQKKEFAKHFIDSGVLAEFKNITDQLNSL